MSLIDAARADAQLWPSTQENLSHALFGSPCTLRQKMTGHKGMRFSVEDSVALMESTGGRNLITEIARQLGGVYLQLPPVDDEVDNADLLAEYHKVTVELGDLCRGLHDSVANDGAIDAQERKHLQDHAHRLNEQVQRYLILSFRVYGK